MQASAASKLGFLLINLGTPDSPSVPDVRKYLGEFLMDPHVLKVPWPIRKLIVGGFILPFRPKQSAEAYASIWSEQGSPLLVRSQALADKLHHRLQCPVALSMRYGSPSIADGMASLAAQGADQVCIVPLYPQYADSTVTTSVEAALTATPEQMNSQVMPVFWQDQSHIQAWGETIRRHLPEQWDHLLFSYHGLPESHLTSTDPTNEHCLRVENCCEQPSTAHATCYRHQVISTTKAIASYLGLPEDSYSVSFQSRLGRIPWLTPYTDQVLEQMPAQGIKNVAVVCPAFIVDNLETLEEMGIQGQETFIEAGGETFTLIPCLNDDDQWIDCLAKLCHAEQAKALSASADSAARSA